jgi:hypothetical protein
MAQFLVGEQSAPAVGVVDDRGLEVGALRRLGLDQVPDVGQVLMTAGVTRPPTVRATIASAKRRPRNSAGWVRGSMQVTRYSP